MSGAEQGDLLFGSTNALTRRRFIIAAGGLAAAAVLPGCGSSASGGNGSSSGKKTLTVGVVQNPGNLDPGSESIVVDIQINGSVFDSLIRRVNGSEKIYPNLATSWEISPDVKSFTFKLRQDVKFHDGTPFNAAAVKATFDHIVDPATKSRAPVSHMQGYTRTEVVDDYTARITFKTPNAGFMNEFASLGLISSPTALKKYGAEYGRHPVGTGPFKFKQWVTGQSVTIERNPDYKWPSPIFKNKGPAYLDEITFKILPDPSARANALRTGSIDLAEALTPQDATPLLANKAQYAKFSAQSVGVPYCIVMNNAKPPLDDVKVRQALIHAVDQETIMKTLFQDYFTPAHQLLTPITPGYDESLNSMYTYDPAKAEALLDEAGWTKGADGNRAKDGKKLVLNFINIADFPGGFDQISQLMQAQLKKVGVGATISAQTFPAVAATYNSGKHNLGDFYDYELDSGVLGAVFGSDQIKAGFNWSHYSNKQVDELLQRGNGLRDQQERADVYKTAHKMIMEGAPAIPLYNLLSYWIGSANLKGLKFDPGGFPYFYDVQFA
jgi:peptide/nickel transport system substrate-binding protein